MAFLYKSKYKKSQNSVRIFFVLGSICSLALRSPQQSLFFVCALLKVQSHKLLIKRFMCAPQTLIE